MNGKRRVREGMNGVRTDEGVNREKARVGTRARERKNGERSK